MYVQHYIENAISHIDNLRYVSARYKVSDEPMLSVNRISSLSNRYRYFKFVKFICFINFWLSPKGNSPDQAVLKDQLTLRKIRGQQSPFRPIRLNIFTLFLSRLIVLVSILFRGIYDFK
jgi:hypothetical protein